MNQAASRFGGDGRDWSKGAPTGAVSRPPHWGGYRLWARTVELWMQGDARLHDRISWSREIDSVGDGEFQPGAWRAERLQP